MRATVSLMFWVLLLGLMAVACSPGLSPTPPIIPPTVVPSSLPSAARSLDANEYRLPSDPSLVVGPNATQIACAGIGADAFLRGSASDPRHVWLEDAATRARSELVWPTGFVARFAPDLQVIDAAGRAAYSGGDHIGGLCVTAGAETFWLP